MDVPSEELENDGSAKDPPIFSVLVSTKPDRNAPSRLAQLERVAKIVSLVALPIVVALGGWWLQRSVAKQAVGKDYVALAVSLLDNSRDVPPEIRGWAVDLLNHNAPVGLADSVIAKLKSGDIGIPGALDARHAVIRSSQTNLTRLIAAAMMRAAPDADLGVYNSGAIRLDSLLAVSELTTDAVTRMLPFSNTIVVLSMPGRLVEQMLETNDARAGTGDYAHTANISYSDRWLIKDRSIDPLMRYNVATTDFLFASGWFRRIPRDSLDIKLIREGPLFRDAVIDQFLSHVVLDRN